jgi:uncharacterized membrane protein
VKYRLIYAVLWLLTVVAYSVPWASADGETFIGWSFTVPFSITYLIGVLLGLIVLAVRFRPVTMTIAAGALMILGVAGAMLGYGAMAALAGLTGAKARAEAGMGLALILSMLYMVAGAYVCRRMAVKKA